MISMAQFVKLVPENLKALREVNLVDRCLIM